MDQIPGYFNRYENFALSRSAHGVLTVRFHTDGAEHTSPTADLTESG